MEKDTVHVFYLKELKELYAQRLAVHGCNQAYEHSTRFKKKILKRIPELIEHKVGRDVILTLQESGGAIFQACDLQDDDICFARAAAIIRNEIIRHCEKNSAEDKQITIVDMILHGSDVVDDSFKESDAALSLTQLLYFNTRKQRLRRTPLHETPFPLILA